MHKVVFGADESEGRCAACHRDHKGVNALKRQDSPLCVNCHGDLKSRHANVNIADAGDFSTSHPTFKLTMVLPGKTGANAVVRVSQDDKATLVERSNLKFPHDVHLDKAGVRGPDGRRQMECKNCHAPDETGTRFKPVTMKKHCQDCHSLEFEPLATNRQVPHGNIEDVISTVNEFYAQAALLNMPIDGAGGRSAAWAKDKANTIVTEMMEKRSCFSCHEISRQGKSWRIAPILISQHWLPKSRFPHSQHSTFNCSGCHDVANSDDAADISIPDLKNCRSCHSGNHPERDKARGTCETCHGFHTGSPRSGKAVNVPKGGVG